MGGISRSPRDPVPAGRFDADSGDFVPAVELDVQMKLAAFVLASDALAFGTLGMMERELEAGTVVALRTPKRMDARSGYGFIRLKNRTPSRPTLAFMQAVREEELRCAEREAWLQERFGACIVD